MNLPNVGVEHCEMSEVRMTIVPTVGLGQPQTNSEAWKLGNWNVVAMSTGSDVAVIPRKNGKSLLVAEMMIAGWPALAVQPIAWARPFAYGLGFLLLLWGCMAWEKWIGWVIW